MYYRTIKKLIGLAFTLVITSKVFGQLNNCINTKEHPLIEEIIDSVKTNRNYNSILAYTVIKGNQLGLARSTILNLAYAWATCKKIADRNQRKDEEFKYLDVILDEKEFESLITYIEKRTSKIFFKNSIFGFINSERVHPTKLKGGITSVL